MKALIRFAFGKAGKVLTGYAVPILASLLVASIAVVGIQQWRINGLQESRATARAQLANCTTANREYEAVLQHLRERALKQLRDAEERREAAERQAQRFAREQAEADRELEKTRRTLAQALAGNSCAADPVPADLARMLRDGQPSL